MRSFREAMSMSNCARISSAEAPMRFLMEALGPKRRLFAMIPSVPVGSRSSVRLTENSLLPLFSV